MGRGVPGLVRPPVAGQVEEDDLEPPVGEIGGQAAAELVVEQEAVEEHEDPRTLAVALVLQAQPFDLECALLEGPSLEEPAHPGDGSEGHETSGHRPGRHRVGVRPGALGVGAVPLGFGAGVAGARRLEQQEKMSNCRARPPRSPRRTTLPGADSGPHLFSCFGVPPGLVGVAAPGSGS